MALRRALLRSAASGQLTADALLDAGERQRVADEPRPRQATRGAAAGLRGRPRQARPCRPATRVLAFLPPSFCPRRRAWGLFRCL